jgi:hypothetical protein
MKGRMCGPPVLSVLVGWPEPQPESPRPMTARDELRQAVQRQSYPGVPTMTWQLMVEGLELTALAVCSEHEGDDGNAALLASCAAASLRRAGHAHPLARRSPYPLTGAPQPGVVGGPVHRVRRTSARLAGLVLGASPADPDLVRRGLEAHESALATWRGDLLARQRRARSLAAS